MTTMDLAAKWFTFPRPNPQAALRLFCFPYAGGGASVFRAWAQALPPTIELCAVQLPGRENRLREPAQTQIEPMINTLDELIAPFTDKPFAFFGHSLGAIIAFELARSIRRRQNTNLVHLVVSARIAPQAVDPEPPIYQLPEAAFIQKLRELNGTPEMVFSHPELLEMLIPVLRADFALNETYVYQPEAPLAVPLTVLGGTEDPKASRSDLEQWAEQAGSTFTLRMLSGDHFFISSAQQAVIRAVSEELQPYVR
jgi:medium-chain acyl-[acyl-carrier-protein] hydrolase